MNRNYPTRLETYNLESLSERYFESSLPRNWRSQKVYSDYGIDLRVDIYDNNQVKGFEFLVQLKASKTASKNNTEKIRLKLTTYNHLLNKLQVVLLVKYIEDINEAFWILLKDIPQPNQSQKYFTVHIPKNNTLSTFSWENFETHVQQITIDKLTTREQIEQMRLKFQDYLCPFCGSMLSSRISAPADSSQDYWDDREEFTCGFQRFGNIIETPCPRDPNFPKIDDYQFNFVYNENEPILKWCCTAIGKTEMSRKFHLGIGYGRTKEESKIQLLEKYNRYTGKD